VPSRKEAVPAEPATVVTKQPTTVTVAVGEGVTEEERDTVREAEEEALLPVLGVAVGEAEGDREEQVILRSTLLPESAMTMEPEARATTPAGELKVARVEKPSREPAEPVPATVLTEPEEGSRPLMRMLEESASSSLPEASTVS
jgi:hypothetical protein